MLASKSTRRYLAAAPPPAHRSNVDAIHHSLTPNISVVTACATRPAGAAQASFSFSPSFPLTYPFPPILFPPLTSTRYNLRGGEGARFGELLQRVAEVDPEMRVRFTSPHPKVRVPCALCPVPCAL